MPTYADQINAGEGRFKLRLVIEGWPFIFVSHASMVQTLADGRQQLLGLDPMTFRISAQADLHRADLREQEMTVEIFDDDEHLVTAALSTVPDATTWLTSDIDATAVIAMDVADTSAFPSSGRVFVHTEVIEYATKSATQLQTLTRGVWGTTPQAHYTADGERRAFPKVTNLPRTLRGRRVEVYVYGEADDPLGAGTLRWRGIARTDLEYQAGVWRFAVEPMSAILDQSIGGDVEEPVPISGIYLPSTGACSFTLVRFSTANWDPSAFVEQAAVALAGRWRTNEEFCADLTAEIAAATSGFGWSSGSEIVAEPLGFDGWRFVYRTGASGATFVLVVGASIPDRSDAPVSGRQGTGVSPVDMFATGDSEGRPTWLNPLEELVYSLAGDTSYTIPIVAPVPRAVIGAWPGGRSPFDDPSRPEYVPNRIYLGGNVAPSASMYAAIRPSGEDGGEDERFAIATGANTSDRYLDFRNVPFARLGPRTRVRLARAIKVHGNVGAMIQALIDDSPSLTNLGALPLVTTEDFDTNFDELRRAIADLLLGASRIWVTAEGVSLRDILTEELKLVGCYLALDATGRLKIKRQRVPLPTDVVSAHVTERAMVGNGLPATSKNVFGHLTEVAIRQGWNFATGEHEGLTIRVRNVEAEDPTVLGGVLEVAPLSRTHTAGDFDLEIDPDDAYLLASTTLGMWGGGYRVVAARVTLGRGEGDDALFFAELGDTLLLSLRHVPNAAGGMGVTAKPATLISYDWNPFEGRGDIRLMTQDRRVGGYCPGFKVASSSGAGTVHTFTLSLADFTSESNVSTWLAVGDRVRVLEYDSASPSIAFGDVTGITDPTQVEVTFDLSFTPYAEMVLSYDNSDAVDEAAPSGRRWAQVDFVFMADAAGKITLISGDVDAYDFSP